MLNSIKRFARNLQAFQTTRISPLEFHLSVALCSAFRVCVCSAILFKASCFSGRSSIYFNQVFFWRPSDLLSKNVGSNRNSSATIDCFGEQFRNIWIVCLFFVTRERADISAVKTYKSTSGRMAHDLCRDTLPSEKFLSWYQNMT